MVFEIVDFVEVVLCDCVVFELINYLSAVG